MMLWLVVSPVMLKKTKKKTKILSVSLGYLDELVVPIIENTPSEADLRDSMRDAMIRYPKATAVLVRRHGVYVYGKTWINAKTQCECYDYLFEAAIRMKQLAIDDTFKEK